MSPCHVKKPLRARFFRFSNIGVLSLVAFALVLLLFPQNVYAVDVTLTWNENTEEHLAGYRVFYRQEGQSYNYNQPAWEGTDTTCTIYALDDETTYCFVVRAYANSDYESADSNEVCYQANSLPTADAGPDQTVDEGQLHAEQGEKEPHGGAHHEGGQEHAHRGQTADGPLAVQQVIQLVEETEVPEQQEASEPAAAVADDPVSGRWQAQVVGEEIPAGEGEFSFSLRLVPEGKVAGTLQSRIGEGEIVDDGTLLGMNYYVEGVQGELPN